MIQSNCWKRGLLAATLGFIAQPGRVNSEPTTAQELPAIVVTPLRGEQSQSDSPAQVHLISPTEDAAGVSARNLPETLREIPSVMVQKTGHGMGSPFLRGFTGFRTLTLVDGVRLNHSVFREGPNQYLSTIDPLSLRVVEVLMGPGSVLYGSDAIGGVLQVLPVEPMDWTGTPDWSGRAILRSAPGEDSVWGRLEFSARPSESLGLIGGVSAKSLGDLRGGKDVGHQPKTGYDEQAGDLRLRWGLAEDVSLTLTHQSVRQDDVWRTHRTVYGLTWKGLKAGDDQRHEFDQARQLTIARLEAGANAATGPFTLTLSRQVQSEDLVRVRKDGRTDRQGFEVTAWGAAAQAGRVTDFGRFDYGVDLQLDEVDSYSRKYSAEDRLQKTVIQGPVADDARYRLLGVFAQHRIPIGAEERVEWISGLRYTHAGAEADRVIDPTGGAPLRIDQDWDTLTGSLRGLLRLDDQGRSKIYFGLSQGYRAPNLSDLTRFDIARSDELEVPARDLDPEQFLCLEAGLRVDASPVRLEAAFYRTWIDGMIVRTPTGRTTDDGLAEVTKRNAGDGYIHGIDGRLDVNLARAWSVWTQVSWMEGEVDGYPTSATEKVREPVSRLMPLTVRAGLKWTRTDGRLWAEAVGESAEKADRLSASDRRDNQRIPPGGTPGYTVCHLRAGYAVTDSLRMSAALENLFDRDYRIHGSGVNESGRNLLLAVEQAF